VASPVSQQTYYVLKQQGIVGPYTTHPIPAPAGFIANFTYNIVNYGENYTIILANGVKSYINTPGYPMLPVYTYKLEINGYIPANSVHAYVFVKHFIVKRVAKPILPAPQPIFYDGKHQNIRYIMNTTIYENNRYYPGKVLSINVLHGLHGKTIIVVRYYPVQYNPMTNTLYCIDTASVYISYPEPVPVIFARKSLLILTTDNLVNITEKLANFYENKGYNVTIVTTSYIWKNCKPINNITQYPGFYNPQFEDSYNGIIAQTYNWTLALKIINYLNKTLGSYDNLLIIGNTSDIPPSFYYHYRFYDGYNNWVPTDFFYASPDLDLAPNIYVGRIPFSNPNIVEKVIEKIIEWYSSGITSSRDIYLSGGYPFGISLMFGETALSMMNLQGQLSMFRVHMLTRTSNNYNRLAVLSLLSGEKRALWYFALCHGSGTALGDRIIVNTGSGSTMTFETLASVKDLLIMKKNAAVPIVSSVACMNAAWDNNVPSTWFSFPSFGEAILLSPAGGIAYIGSARVAAELGIMFYIMNGIEMVQYFGATYLHYNILKAYAELMGKTNTTTLGYVVDTGILDYIASVPMVDTYVLGEAFKLALLGDSNLILPVWSQPAEKSYLTVKGLTNYVAELPASLIAYFARGYLPLYGITQKAIITLIGSQNSINVYDVKIVNSFGFLVDYNIVNTTNVYIPASGAYNYTLSFNKYVNGLMLVKFSLPEWGEVRVLLGALGLIVVPDTVGAGEPVCLGVYGMDLMGSDTINVYVAGRLIIPSLPLSYGSVIWKFALPYIAPGKYNVTILPTTYANTNLLKALSKFLSQEIKVVKTDNLVIVTNAPPIVEPGNNVTILLHTYYAGKSVDAEIKAYIIGPGGKKIEPIIKKIGTGLYALVFTPENPGHYSVSIEARSSSQYLELRGYTGFSLVAVTSLYNGFQTVSQELRLLAEHVNENFTSLSSLLRTEVLSEIKSNNALLNTVKQEVESYKPVLSQLQSQLNKVNSSLASISSKITSMSNEIVNLRKKTEELMSLLNQAKNNIVNTINSLSSSLSENITSLENRVSTVTTYSEGGLILSIIILVAVIVIGYIKRK
ncbi:MAG: hypothetical protein GXO43_08870, partial [Crenarchaeota archaeon]|nr:hypothetical protein [Thermoproteota archaeon]